MKILLAVMIFCSIFFVSIENADAQVGFNPEYLGNASAPAKPGFALKYFLSYFNQQGISAHDFEMALEPQLFITGFSGDPSKDQIQFVAHLPFGYRRQNNNAGGSSSVFGIGSLAFNVESFWHLVDNDTTEVWFDNAVSSSFPTATIDNGVALGGRNYSIGWFQECYIRHRNFIVSIMPMAVQWNFRDEKSHILNGLSMNIANGSVGYAINDSVSLGVDFGLLLGRVGGAEDRQGNSLGTTVRAYMGPAAAFSFTHNISLQVGSAIDFATKRTQRGQGIFFALWHHF